MLLDQIRAAGLPEPEREYRIIKDRKFRWDFAWPECLLAVEVQGGTWVVSGHSTGTGIARDCEKANLATLQGWHLLSFTSDQVKDNTAITFLRRALAIFAPF